MQNHRSSGNENSIDSNARGTARSRNRALASLVAGFLCMMLPANVALADVENPLLPKNLSPWGMFLNADIVVKAVMIGLAIASLVTWTIWLAKTIELRMAMRRVRRRLAMLERGGLLAEVARTCDGARDAVAQLVLSTAREAELSGGIIDDGFKERVALRLERVEAAMTRQVSRGIGILATIGATAPFVGLFGTVWGIMTAFQAIAIEKNTNLSVVAPAIAQALFATAVGLATAIPAYIAYNKFSTDAGRYAARLEAFADDLVTAIQRRVAERL
jgi:biopolymer transport protein ExbB